MSVVRRVELIEKFSGRVPHARRVPILAMMVVPTSTHPGHPGFGRVIYGIRRCHVCVGRVLFVISTYMYEDITNTKDELYGSIDDYNMNKIKGNNGYEIYIDNHVTWPNK